MYVSADPAMQRLAREANEILAKDGKAFEPLPMPHFEDMYGPGGDEALVPMGDVSPDKPCLIIHSSGESLGVALLAAHESAEWTCSYVCLLRIYGVPQTGYVLG